MRRRTTILCLAATAFFRTGGAVSQGNLPLLVVLEPGAQHNVGAQAFFERLRELGWTEGRNHRIERRFGDWNVDRMQAHAREAAGLGPRLIFTHSIAGLRAALAATTSIPIVAYTADMVAEGFVSSLATPGGNVTGVTTIQRELDTKRLEMLREARPAIRKVGFLTVPATSPTHVAGLTRAAEAFGLRLEVGRVEDISRIEETIDALVARGVDSLLMQNAALLSREGGRVAECALRNQLPAISESPLFAERGGLLQYGANIPVMFRQLALQADKVLRGARPADLPVEQPAKIELIVNQRTAAKLGVHLPALLLARADEVIQ